MNQFPIALACPIKHRAKVDKLVDYCAKLDDSEITVIEISNRDDESFKTPFPQNRFACLQSNSMRKAAQRFKGQPFIWIETDSIPLQPGWAVRLETEYHRLGKEFMLSADSYPIHDLVGGIGVYGPNTHWLMVWHYPFGAWDLWLRNNLTPLVSYSPLIRHSYGIYSWPGGKIKCDPHKFPRDRSLLRASSVIFHRDKDQTLIDNLPLPK